MLTYPPGLPHLTPTELLKSADVSFTPLGHNTFRVEWELTMEQNIQVFALESEPVEVVIAVLPSTVLVRTKVQERADTNDGFFLASLLRYSAYVYPRHGPHLFLDDAGSLFLQMKLLREGLTGETLKSAIRLTASTLLNLSASYYWPSREELAKYEESADWNALERAVKLAKYAAATSEIGDYKSYEHLASLADMLGLLSYRDGNEATLDLAITAIERAKRAAESHNKEFFIPICQAIASRLQLQKYYLTYDRDTLAAAVDNAEKAVELHTWKDRAAYPQLLDTLSDALASWGSRMSDAASLERAVQLARESLALTEGDYSDKAERIAWLSERLEDLYELQREQETRQEAISLLEEACLRLELLVSASTESTERLLAPPTTRLRGFRLNLARLYMERSADGDLERANKQLTLARQQQELEMGRQRGELENLRYLRGRESLYVTSVRCSLLLAAEADVQGEAAVAREHRSAAWQAAEEGKGRLFAALLAAERRVLAEDDADVAALEARIDSLREEIDRLQTLVDLGRGRGSGTNTETGPEILRKALNDRHLKYVEAIKQLERLDRELASLTAVSPLPLDRVQEQLHHHNTRLLELFPLENSLVLFLVDGSSIQVSTAPLPLQTVTAWTKELETLTQKDEEALSPAISERFEALLEQIGEVLQPALEERLGPLTSDSPSELLTVPTGPLHLWPLHLLPYRDGILWDYFSISYGPTADTFVYCQERKPEFRDRHLLLAPNADLPATFLEAVHARQRGWQVELLEDALPETLRRHPGDFALASHVRLDPAKRGEVNQVLFGKGPFSALELLRILRGRPKAEHGMLGSCSAHYEEAREGDSLSGLTRSLLASGLRSLTSSLWPVDDLVACYLDCRFRELAYGDGYASKALALREAALELKAQGWGAISKWIEEQLGYLEGEELALALGLRAACGLNDGKSEEYLVFWQLYQEALPSLPENGPLHSVLATVTHRYGKVYDWMATQDEHLSAAALQQAVDRQVRDASRPLDGLLYGPMILLGTPLVA